MMDWVFWARGRRAAERELPVVYTEMDGGFNTRGGAPRRILWTNSGRKLGRVVVLLKLFGLWPHFLGGLGAHHRGLNV